MVTIISSETVITDTSEVSLISEIRLLARLGTASRTACGAMTKRTAGHQPRPSDSAASHCPRSTPAIAPRRLSDR
ncbi:hypothetical protein D3C84_1269890 [compost metagenome]